MLESSDCSLPWKLNQQQRTEPLIALTVACVTKRALMRLFFWCWRCFLVRYRPHVNTLFIHINQEVAHKARTGLVQARTALPMTGAPAAATMFWNGLLPGLSKSVDITSNSSFQPAGTILTSSGGIPLPLYAHKGGGYDPEQVFFRCTPDTAGQLYEARSTNGDDTVAGWYEATDVPGAYLTIMKMSHYA